MRKRDGYQNQPGPKLMSTPHSTIHVFEWGIDILRMECESFHTEDSPFKYMDCGVMNCKCGMLSYRHKF